MRIWNRGIFDSLSELAQAPDEEREAALAEATRRSLTLLTLLGFALLTLGGVCGFTLGSLAGGAISRLMRSESIPYADGTGRIVRVALVCLLVGGAAWFMLRLRRAVLIRAMRRMRRASDCPSCGYSLVGIRAVEGFVSCPECAASVREIELAGFERGGEVRGAGLPKAWGNRAQKESES